MSEDAVAAAATAADVLQNTPIPEAEAPQRRPASKCSRSVPRLAWHKPPTNPPAAVPRAPESDLDVDRKDGLLGDASKGVANTVAAATPAANSLLDQLPTTHSAAQHSMPPPSLPVPPSPIKRAASPAPEEPAPKRIKTEPIDETSVLSPSPLSSQANAMLTTAAPVSLPSPAVSAAPTMTAAVAAVGASPVAAPVAIPSVPQTLPAAPSTPLPSIEKSPSVKLEPGKETATPEPAKEQPTPDSQAPTPRAAAHPRKRRRMLEAPAQALRGMNMQLLGITAVQVLEWLSQEPFEESIDALRDLDSDFYASYSFKVTQFEQAWRNFSQTEEDLLEWRKLGLDDQKHRKTVRLANLTRFGIDLFSEDETYLPTLHDRFFKVFVYGTRKFTIDHSNLLLELKTQLALYLLTENKTEKTPTDVLHEAFVEGLEAKLKERSWNLDSFDDEYAMLTSAEIRMSLLLQEYEESGNNAQVLMDRYPPDSLLRQLGSYIHGELVAHADHCQTLAVSARTVGKQQVVTHRSVSLQDDDDYWQKTSGFIADQVKALLAEVKDPKPAAADTKTVEATSGAQSATPATTPAATPAATPAGAEAQASTAGNTPQPQEAAASAPNADVKPLSEAVLNGIGTELGLIRQFINQKITVREAELARASLPATTAPAPAPVHHDATAQNLYLLKTAQLPQAQQPPFAHQLPGATAPGQAPTGPPLVPMPGHAQAHLQGHALPHGGLPQVPNHGPGLAPGHGRGTAAPGELPPNQTCPTSILYDKARQAALSKSTAHTRREGIHSTRRPWTPEEEKALMTGLDMVKGPHWSQILSLFGPNGTISDVLKDRTQVQLKDKARNLKLFFLKTQSEMPYYLSAVTGELKTRAPNQAARKEAEERARLSREEDQAKAQGLLGVFPEICTTPAKSARKARQPPQAWRGSSHRGRHARASRPRRPDHDAGYGTGPSSIGGGPETLQASPATSNTPSAHGPTPNSTPVTVTPSPRPVTTPAAAMQNATAASTAAQPGASHASGPCCNAGSSAFPRPFGAGFACPGPSSPARGGNGAAAEQTLRRRPEAGSDASPGVGRACIGAGPGSRAEGRADYAGNSGCCVGHDGRDRDGFYPGTNLDTWDDATHQDAEPATFRVDPDEFPAFDVLGAPERAPLARDVAHLDAAGDAVAVVPDIDDTGESVLASDGGGGDQRGASREAAGRDDQGGEVELEAYPSETIRGNGEGNRGGADLVEAYGGMRAAVATSGVAPPLNQARAMGWFGSRITYDGAPSPSPRSRTKQTQAAQRVQCGWNSNGWTCKYARANVLINNTRVACRFCRFHQCKKNGGCSLRRTHGRRVSVLPEPHAVHGNFGRSKVYQLRQGNECEQQRRLRKPAHHRQRRRPQILHRPPLRRPGCKKESGPKAVFCPGHTCEGASCAAYARGGGDPGSWERYCDRHRVCMSEGATGSATSTRTASRRSAAERGGASTFCKSHECKAAGCFFKKRRGDWCPEHILGHHLRIRKLRAKVVTSRSFCPAHLCTIRECTNPVTGTPSALCAVHKCSLPHCIAPRWVLPAHHPALMPSYAAMMGAAAAASSSAALVIAPSPYCVQHACSYPTCAERAEPETQRCRDHTRCRRDGCPRFPDRAGNSTYCPDHRPTHSYHLDGLRPAVELLEGPFDNCHAYKVAICDPR
ncbi:unnamed protein product [Parascedosporium putredinis]|uniref:HTH myb-type domain-containing protein n=1 Tax=Parascedosporium putredinis TaxID=1442378 RepID=A0A9P1MCR8_9PEZI|nr:unnamed protein product [Parascedosporium putredinis]CAI8001175.1 unnamed protein product [Parascedosporium putredinis]